MAFSNEDEYVYSDDESYGLEEEVELKGDVEEIILLFRRTIHQVDSPTSDHQGNTEDLFKSVIDHEDINPIMKCEAYGHLLCQCFMKIQRHIVSRTDDDDTYYEQCQRKIIETSSEHFYHMCEKIIPLLHTLESMNELLKIVSRVVGSIQNMHISDENHLQAPIQQAKGLLLERMYHTPVIEDYSNSSSFKVCFDIRLELGNALLEYNWSMLQNIVNNLYEFTEKATNVVSEQKRLSMLQTVHIFALKVYESGDHFEEEEREFLIREAYQKLMLIVHEDGDGDDGSLPLYLSPLQRYFLHFEGGRVYSRDGDWHKAYLSFIEAFYVYCQVPLQAEQQCPELYIHIVLTAMLTLRSINHLDERLQATFSSFTSFQKAKRMFNAFESNNSTEFVASLSEIREYYSSGSHRFRQLLDEMFQPLQTIATRLDTREREIALLKQEVLVTEEQFILSSMSGGSGMQLSGCHRNIKKNYRIALAAVVGCPSALQFVPRKYSSNQQFIELVLESGADVSVCHLYVHESLKDDRQGMLKMIKSGHHRMFPYCSDRLRADAEVVLHAVQADGLLLKFASSAMIDDVSVVKSAFMQNMSSLVFASPEMKRLFIEEHHVHIGRMWSSTSSEFRDDQDIVLGMVQHYSAALEDASLRCKADYEVVHTAVTFNGLSLQHAHVSLQDNTEIVLAALSSSMGQAIKYVSERLRDDFAFMLSCPTSSLLRLKHASLRLKNDPKFVRLMISENGYALEHASESLRDDFDLVRQAICTSFQSSFIFSFASLRLRDNEELALLSMRRTPSVLASSRLSPRLQYGGLDRYAYDMRKRYQTPPFVMLKVLCAVKYGCKDTAHPNYTALSKIHMSPRFAELIHQRIICFAGVQSGLFYEALMAYTASDMHGAYLQKMHDN